MSFATPGVPSWWIGAPSRCFLAAPILWYSGAKHSSPALLSGRPFGANSRLWHHLWFFKVFLKINVGLYSICHAVDFILSLCISMHQSTSLWCLGLFLYNFSKCECCEFLHARFHSRSFGRPNAFSHRLTHMIPCCESLFSSSALWASLQRIFQIMKAFRCMSSCCINFFSCPAGFAVSAGLLCLLGSLCGPR